MNTELSKLNLFEVPIWLNRYEQYRKDWNGYQPTMHRETGFLIGALWFDFPEYHKLLNQKIDEIDLSALLTLLVELEYHEHIRAVLQSHCSASETPVL